MKRAKARATIDDCQTREIMDSSASRMAVGKLVPWMQAVALRLSGGNQRVAKRMFGAALLNIANRDISRFQDDDGFLKKVILKAMEYELE
jgi:hypothetical protein